MDLSPKTTVTSPVRDKTWLGSQHGTDCPRTITLDIAGGTFAAVLVAGAPGSGTSVIPSGTALVKGGDNLYDRATGVGVEADGHLFEDVIVNTGAGASTAAGASLLWHGVVVQAQLPAGSAFADENRAAHILYV